MGTDKQSIASKKQWSKLNKKQRQQRMKPLTEGRWKKINKKQRSEHAKLMAKARWAKINGTD